MKSILCFAFAAFGSAAVLRRDQCCFQLTASGGVSGVMGQLDDGQNRLNGTYSAATYCYSNGGITDSNGRGCIVTTTNDATHQFQCDEGTSAQAGFSISANGTLSFDGSDQFYACPYNNGNIIEYNVYTQELAGQDKCRSVKLSTGGQCAASASSCAMATTTIYGTAPAATMPAYTPVQSMTSYGSPSVVSSASSMPVRISSAVETYSTPQSIISSIPVSVAYSSQGTVPGYTHSVATSALSSAPAYSATPSVPATPSSSIVSVPAYSAASSTLIEASSPVISIPAYSTSPSTPSSIASIPASSTYMSSWASSSSSSASVPAYTVTPGTSATPSTSIVSVPAYSVASSSWAEVSSATVSVPGYSAVTSSPAASVPVYNVSSTWVTVASASSLTGVAETTSSVAIASTYSSASTTVPATSTSASVCQTALTGAYQTPHLIVPISSSSPDTAYGTQYNAYIDSENSTIFNFDIPSSYEDMTCTTIFLFPELADLETSSYTFSGSGDIVFSELSTYATEETTYNNAPSVSSVLDTIAIQSGNSYVVASGSCAAGSTVSIELSSQNGLSLEFFEDWNPSSLGLYITAC